MVGCSSNNDKNEELSTTISTDNAELICESTVSPNEKYVKTEEDKVTYAVTVYQNKNYSIIINANANSAFFDEMQYVLEYNGKITESNIKIQWTTLMGNPESTEEDQIGIAIVFIGLNNEIISERKINFAKKAIDIVIDNLDQNQSFIDHQVGYIFKKALILSENKIRAFLNCYKS